MSRKAILLVALIAFSCTSSFGQKYVISLVHGDASSPHGVHEHIYESWDELISDKHAAAHNHLNTHEHICNCDCHSCFVHVDGDYAEVYSFKTLNELPTTNLLLGELQLSLVDFIQVKSIIPSDVNWLFDFVDRLERPPTFQLS